MWFKENASLILAHVGPILLAGLLLIFSVGPFNWPSDLSIVNKPWLVMSALYGFLGTTASASSQLRHLMRNISKRSWQIWTDRAFVIEHVVCTQWIAMSLLFLAIHFAVQR